jgi:hypothetical protein
MMKKSAWGDMENKEKYLLLCSKTPKCWHPVYYDRFINGNINAYDEYERRVHPDFYDEHGNRKTTYP